MLIEKGMDPNLIYKPQELKSLPTLEKIVPKGQQITAWLGDLVVRPEGSPKLVKDKESAKEDFA